MQKSPFKLSRFYQHALESFQDRVLSKYEIDKSWTEAYKPRSIKRKNIGLIQHCTFHWR